MSLYDELKLKGPNVSQEEVKRAFRDSSKVYHPDKGGNLEKYKQIVAAYEILGNPDKKLEYDLKQIIDEKNNVSYIVDLGACVYHHLKTVLNPAFKQSEQVVEKEIKVTLEDLYNCVKKKLKITSGEICQVCNAQGGTRKECTNCGGRSEMCEICDMKGFLLDPVCRVCDGKQYLTISKFIIISLSPTIEPNIPIDIKGVIDSRSTLRIHLVEVPHAKYFRSNNDLIIKANISILNCFGNLEYLHHHLDDQEYLLVYNNIIPPGCILRAKNMGLLGKNSDKRGDLLIEFNHIWPSSMSEITNEAKFILQQGTNLTNSISSSQKIILLERFTEISS